MKKFILCWLGIDTISNNIVITRLRADIEILSREIDSMSHEGNGVSSCLSDLYGKVEDLESIVKVS